MINFDECINIDQIAIKWLKIKQRVNIIMQVHVSINFSLVEIFWALGVILMKLLFGQIVKNNFNWKLCKY